MSQSLERNQIYQMDCLDGIKLIASNSVKLIVTDPPYFLGMTHNGQRGSFVDLAICKPFYKELFQEFKRVLTHDGEIYFFSDWRGYAFYYPLFDSIIGCKNLIVWDKMAGPGSYYTFNHEFILFYCGDVNVRRRGANVWRLKGFSAGAKTTNGPKVHDTQKPLELIEKIIMENSKPGELVLDTFGGSGTTAVICRKSGRDYIVFELDDEHYDASVRRSLLPVQSTFFKDREDPQ